MVKLVDPKEISKVEALKLKQTGHTGFIYAINGDSSPVLCWSRKIVINQNGATFFHVRKVIAGGERQ